MQCVGLPLARVDRGPQDTLNVEVSSSRSLGKNLDHTITSPPERKWVLRTSWLQPNRKHVGNRGHFVSNRYDVTRNSPWHIVVKILRLVLIVDRICNTVRFPLVLRVEPAHLPL